MNRLGDVIDVLQRFDSAVGDGNWEIEDLNSGGQAVLYRARVHDGRALYQDCTSLVVKLYRCPTAGGDAIEEERESLSLLRDALDDATVSGWKATCPVLVSHSMNPPALVLTEVTGIQLENYLIVTPGLSREFIDGVGDALLDALKRFWAVSPKPYGDTHLNNVLCDPQQRTLSFIDPGRPRALFECDSVSADFYPDSRDLAYLLFDMGLLNAQYIRGRGALAVAAAGLMGRILEGYLDNAGLNGNSESFWREVDACVEVHVSSMRGSRFPRSLWQRYLRFQASRNVVSFCSAYEQR